MKAIVVREHGGLEALKVESRPIPEPGPGEVRVQLEAAALNHLDVWVRKGVPGVKYPLPMVLGCDGAGVIAALGEGVSGLTVGDKVVLAPGLACGACGACSMGKDHLCRHYGILGEHRDGTFAETIVVPAKNALPKPSNLTFAEAATVPLVFLTAWHMLVDRAELQLGEDVLIHAAGSGVSTAGIQIAKLLQARVMVTAGSKEKLKQAQVLGADLGVNYREEDFAAIAKSWTGKRGLDVIFDHVGKETWGPNLRSLTRGGRLVLCGNTSGPMAETSLPHIFFKSLSVLGSTMGSRGELHTILELVSSGKLKPVLHETIQLKDIAKGHRMLEERSVFGKVAVAIGEHHDQS
ncbi:MAG: zinc-binding dehydrogenase [Candidatus Eisenbacteria bacterium]|uniref:Zinc-binding dehydrogenase n=1 Tax=Eiseniibacteriota bacterium TaxID=2212470 RepID=A0A7Y2H372_UNCEI|nr:zinc-binding dehydrogenase [Candidatus Eisenbacteria bacterium]